MLCVKPLDPCWSASHAFAPQQEKRCHVDMSLPRGHWTWTEASGARRCASPALPG